MTNIIDLLEKATGPDRHLDEEIYRAVIDEFAPSFKQYRGMVWGNADNGISVLRYTKSIDDALTLVPEGLEWSASNCVLRRLPGSVPPNFKGWAGVYGEPMVGSECDAYGATPAIALCIAALHARTFALTSAQDKGAA